MRFRPGLAVLAACATTLSAGDSPPIVVALEDEVFLTGGDTSGGARVTMDSEGNFLGLHVNAFGGVIDGRGGTPEGLGSPFSFGGGSRGAGVAAMGGGEFVISWSQDQYPPDFFEHAVLRTFDLDGSPTGPEVQVSDAPIETIGARTAVGTRPDAFLVVWEASSANGLEIRGRHMPFAGAPGPSFPVNSWTTGQHTDPRLAVRGDGSALVVWRNDACGPADPVGCIRARHFDSAGDPTGLDFALNSTTSGSQTQPAVAVAGDGFVAAWLSQDCDQCIRARRVGADGVPVGDDFRVDLDGSGGDGPGVGGRASGSFVVAWRRFTDGEFRAYGRAFDATGLPTTGEFQVNTSAMSDAYDVDVGMSSAGDFVVLWSNNYELWGRRLLLRDLVFADGFESGDTSAWSSTIP